MSVCVKVQVFPTVTSHSHKELPTCVYVSLYAGFEDLFSASFTLRWHCQTVWHLLCSITREGWSAGTLVFGTEWACWTAPWAASLKEQSTFQAATSRCQVVSADVSLSMLVQPHGTSLHCLKNKLQPVHHYVTLYTAFIWLTVSYPAPLFHHFCLCVHFISTLISWSHVILICVFVDRVQGLPSVSALKFNGSLTMAVGTSTGQVSQKLFV